jgi:hypothetical protein
MHQCRISRSVDEQNIVFVGARYKHVGIHEEYGWNKRRVLMIRPNSNIGSADDAGFRYCRYVTENTRARRPAEGQVLCAKQTAVGSCVAPWPFIRLSVCQIICTLCVSGSDNIRLPIFRHHNYSVPRAQYQDKPNGIFST